MPFAPIPLEDLANVYTRGVQRAREEPRGDNPIWNFALGAMGSLPINTADLLSMLSPGHITEGAEKLGYAIGDAVARQNVQKLATQYPFELAMVLPGPRKLLGKRLPPSLRFYAEEAKRFPTPEAFTSFLAEPVEKLHKRLAMEIVHDPALEKEFKQFQNPDAPKELGMVRAASVPIGRTGDFIRHPYTRQFLSPETLKRPVYAYATDSPFWGGKVMGFRHPAGKIYINILAGDDAVWPRYKEGYQYPYEIFLEEVFHEERARAGRDFKMTNPDGTPIPYKDIPFEQSAKKAVQQFTPFELPGRTLFQQQFLPREFYEAARRLPPRVGPPR